VDCRDPNTVEAHDFIHTDFLNSDLKVLKLINFSSNLKKLNVIVQ